MVLNHGAHIMSATSCLLKKFFPSADTAHRSFKPITKLSSAKVQVCQDLTSFLAGFHFISDVSRTVCAMGQNSTKTLCRPTNLGGAPGHAANVSPTSLTASALSRTKQCRCSWESYQQGEVKGTSNCLSSFGEIHDAIFQCRARAHMDVHILQQQQ